MSSPIYQSKTQYSKEEFLKYQEAIGESNLSNKTITFNFALAAVGAAFICFLNLIGAGISFIVLAVFNILASYLIMKLSEKRKYERNKVMWSSLVDITLYLEFARLSSGTWKTQNYDYDEFYRIIETDERIYLLAGPRDILIIEQSKCSKELKNAIRSLPGYKENK